MQAIHRRQQFWGELYYHTTHAVTAVQPTGRHGTPSHQFDLQPMRWLLDRFVTESPYRTCPVFRDSSHMPNQCLVNEYVFNQVLFRSFGDKCGYEIVQSICQVLGDLELKHRSAIAGNQFTLRRH